MNTSKFLSRLHLPMWVHICPKCRKEVKANSHECPHCGEKYPLTLKVPPEFLNDKKKLEAYVHEHIFPRISAWERNYLTQFFTVFFSDTFASGDFSAWSFIAGSPTIVKSPVYGSDSYAMSCNGSGVVYAPQISGASNFFISYYVYFGSIPTNSWMVFTNIYDASWGNQFCFGINFLSTSNTGQWLAGVSSSPIYSSAYTVNAGQWYFVQVQRQVGAGNGVVNMWIDGVNVISSSNQTIINDAAIFSVGQGSGTAIDFFVDNFVAADAYLPDKVNVSDGGSGLDVLTINASATLTDSGSSSDSIAYLQAKVPISDEGLGSDALSSLQAQIPVSDAGAGSDNVEVQGTMLVSEVSSGEDSIANLQGRISVFDSGLSSDAVSIQAQIFISDAAASLDSAIVNVSSVVIDVGLGSDALTVALPISISDVGLGADIAIVVLSRLATHAIIIQSEKGNVTVVGGRGVVTLQSDSDQ